MMTNVVTSISKQQHCQIKDAYSCNKPSKITLVRSSVINPDGVIKRGHRIYHPRALVFSPDTRTTYIVGLNRRTGKSNMTQGQAEDITQGIKFNSNHHINEQLNPPLNHLIK